MDGEGLLSVGSWRETALCTSRGRNIIMRKNEKDQSQDYYCKKLAVLLCSVKRGDYVRY